MSKKLRDKYKRTVPLRLEVVRAEWREHHFRQQGGVCFYCGLRMRRSSRSKDPHHLSVMCTLDHVVPLSRGGSDSLENTVAACGRCNAEKANMTADEFRGARDAEAVA